MTRPMTTEELFDRVHGILKEKNLIPEILDYSLATQFGKNMILLC